jgi:hypothetical protein
MCKHLRIVLPNEPGEAAGAIRQLVSSSPQDFNVLGYMLADLGDAGVLHLLVTHHDKALLLLKDKYKNRVAEKEVIIVRVPNKPGELLPLLEALAAASINVRTSYQAASETGMALIVTELNNPEDRAKALKVLKKMKVTLVTEQP